MTNLTKEQKKEILEEMGGGEWWKSAIQGVLERKMEELMERGFSYQEAFSFIEGIIGCIREEYGD